jgi:hypothetical protein
MTKHLDRKLAMIDIIITKYISNYIRLRNSIIVSSSQRFSTFKVTKDYSRSTLKKSQFRDKIMIGWTRVRDFITNKLHGFYCYFLSPFNYIE